MSMNLVDQVELEIKALLDMSGHPPTPIEVALVQTLATYRLTQAVMAVAERLEYPLRKVDL